MKLIEFSRLLNKLICISYILTGKLGKNTIKNALIVFPQYVIILKNLIFW